MNGRKPAMQESLADWVRIPPGRFLMGSWDFYPDERPQHQRAVEAFDMSRTPVTNAQYAAFAAATGYVTLAERGLDRQDFPLRGIEELDPGSLVFTPPDGPVDLRDWRSWWSWVPGANWRHPLGPGSALLGLDEHPVVHIAYPDALAYAQWIGARLPTEAEYEWAASGGHAPLPYSWGRERDPDGVALANTWHGRFPYLNSSSDGWFGTSPVGMFPPNGFELYDSIGNVWEWTDDLYTSSHAAAAGIAPYESPVAVPSRVGSSEGADGIPRRVLKGGSHLSAPEHSLSYRPAARMGRAEDSASSDTGFRCVRTAGVDPDVEGRHDPGWHLRPNGP
ncbi:formylglycine-generating enzyme family protein [Arthrobacter sp. HY1533]|uniref:formylglycine-generating enzyme family protein n=1 Tax=Arthrobacter sp. HY1533 TaxID=2970919 RepID=UPI0022B9ECB8|nr:formylglycine-generating enzyme family protein [Arthrobacter sp. HY1533]